MSSDPSLSESSQSQPSTAEQPSVENAAPLTGSTLLPEGGLASIVRKTMGKEEQAPSGSQAPASDQQRRGGRPDQRGGGGPGGAGGGRGRPNRGGGPGGAGGQRKPKPAGGDAPGDDGEQPDYQVREASNRSQVAVPSKRAALSDDLEAELQAAMGDMSLDEIASGEGVRKSAEGLEADSRQRGQVLRIHGDNVFIALGGRNEGVASLRSFHEPPPVGEMIEVIISGQSREDGLYNLGVPGGPIVTGNWSDIREG